MKAANKLARSFGLKIRTELQSLKESSSTQKKNCRTRPDFWLNVRLALDLVDVMVVLGEVEYEVFNDIPDYFSLMHDHAPPNTACPSVPILYFYPGER